MSGRTFAQVVKNSGQPGRKKKVEVVSILQLKPISRSGSITKPKKPTKSSTLIKPAKRDTQIGIQTVKQNIKGLQTEFKKQKQIKSAKSIQRDTQKTLKTITRNIKGLRTEFKQKNKQQK